MTKKQITLLAILMIIILAVSPVSAGGAIKLSGSFKLGSLISKGFATGLGNTDWVLVLDGVGHAGVVCTNKGENDVPGQSFPHVEGSGIQVLTGNDPLRKNGKSPYEVTAKSQYEETQYISWEEGGCPNSNWTARVDFIFWDSASITVYDPLDTGYLNPVATYKYECVTTYTGPNGTATTFDDGSVSCVKTYPAN